MERYPAVQCVSGTESRTGRGAERQLAIVLVRVNIWLFSMPMIG